ncbi:MAG: hypothetical protein ACK5XN_06930 [Bacteroidota bacterium]
MSHPAAATEFFAELQQLLHKYAAVAPVATPAESPADAAAPLQATATAPPCPSSTRAPSAPKMMPPASFSGRRGENIADFCFNITRYVQYHSATLSNTPEGVLIASSYLAGSAARWWSVHCERHPPPVSVRDFCELLAERYRAPNLEVHVMDRLCALEQRDSRSGLGAYTKTFLDLVSDLPCLRERELVYHYTSGLLPRLQAELRVRAPATLVEAMNLADTLDETWRDALFVPSGRSWTPQQPSSLQPSPQSPDLSTTTPPPTHHRRSHHHSTPPPLCQLCRQRGHTAATCPRLPPGTDTTTTTTSSQTEQKQGNGMRPYCSA